MSVLKFRNLSKHFGQRAAVVNVDVEIEAGEFFSVLGPSGCGKTTLLRMVAGFEKPSSGQILLGERDITRLSPGERGVAMVFQNYALFPRMNVFDNVAFGLEVKRLPRQEIQKRVMRALEGVHLQDRHRSSVSELSGGEQQRVAVARAIVVEPAVLLFDEPLSNLDVALRSTTRREIKELQSRLGITTLYVTHDQSEAMSLSTRVAVMRNGTFLQVGSPVETYERPESSFVAEFLGSANLLTGRIDQGTGSFSVAGSTFVIPRELVGRVGNEVIAAIKPESIVPLPAGQGDGITGVVQSVEFQGFAITLLVRFGATIVRSTFPVTTVPRIPAIGETLYFRIDWPRCSFFDQEK